MNIEKLMLNSQLCTFILKATLIDSTSNGFVMNITLKEMLKSPCYNEMVV